MSCQRGCSGERRERVLSHLLGRMSRKKQAGGCAGRSRVGCGLPACRSVPFQGLHLGCFFPLPTPGRQRAMMDSFRGGLGWELLRINFVRSARGAGNCPLLFSDRLRGRSCSSDRPGPASPGALGILMAHPAPLDRSRTIPSISPLTAGPVTAFPT